MSLPWPDWTTEEWRRQLGEKVSTVARLDVDTLRLARTPRAGVVYVPKYSEDQARDDSGKWTSGGGGGKAPTGASDADDDISSSVAIPPHVLAAFQRWQAAEAKRGDDGLDPQIAEFKAMGKDTEEIEKIDGELKELSLDPVFNWDEDPENPIVSIIANKGYGHSTDGRVMKQGEPNDCHRNVAKLYINKEIDSFVTGYAHTHGFWFRHSWGLKDGKVVETTQPFDKYYGAPLTNLVAKMYAERQL